MRYLKIYKGSTKHRLREWQLLMRTKVEKIDEEEHEHTQTGARERLWAVLVRVCSYGRMPQGKSGGVRGQPTA